MSLESLIENLSLEEIKEFKKILKISLEADLSLSDLYHKTSLIKSPLVCTFYKYKIENRVLKKPGIAIEKDTVTIIESMKNVFTLNITTEQIKNDKITPKKERYGYSICNLNDKILIYGGTNRTKTEYYDDILIFDTSENAWVEEISLEQGPEPRYNHCACIIGDLMLVTGGIGSKGWLRDMFAIDINSLFCSEIETQGFIGRKYRSCKSIAIKNNMYVFGVYIDQCEYKNEMIRINIKDMIAVSYNIPIGLIVVLDRVLDIKTTNSLILVVGICECSVVALYYHLLMDLWGVVYCVEELEPSQETSMVSCVPLVIENTIFLVKFFMD